MSLIEHKFVKDAPRNAYGIAPFKDPTDFSTLNEAYFAYADWIMDRAEKLGILVLLAPAYLGVNGGDEGWYHDMRESGVAKLRRYGEYIGRLFARHKNIVWMHGGDYNPPERQFVTAIEEGIREFDSTSLRTAHPGPETSARSHWEDQPWLDLDTIYSYQPIKPVALSEYALQKPMPFILIESAYENEHGATEQRLRAQAYQAMLGGACGQVFGNNPIWHFNGPGLFETPTAWRRNLASRGAASMTYLRELFERYPWWNLIPDKTLIPDTQSGGQSPSVALSRDRTLAIVYSPSANALTIDLRQMSGTKVTGKWFDPSSGIFQLALTASHERLADFKVPGRNAAGYDDWILVLRSAPLNAGQLQIDKNAP